MAPEPRLKPTVGLEDSFDLLDYFTRPRNVGSLDPDDPQVGTGMVGAPAEGNVFKLALLVDANGSIRDARFRTYGCAFAIATTSWLTEWVKGKTLTQARALDSLDIALRLQLPAEKLHCSVLAEDVLKAAIDDYQRKRQKDS